jgi:hypothetical protein
MFVNSFYLLMFWASLELHGFCRIWGVELITNYLSNFSLRLDCGKSEITRLVSLGLFDELAILLTDVTIGLR